MTTSPKTLWKSASSLEDAAIAPALLGYFHGLAQDEAHEIVVRIFQELSRDEGVTRAMLSRRLEKTPEQITRWLSAPGNWTMDTFTNLLIAMGHRPTFGAERLSDMRPSNQYHPAVLVDAARLSFTYESRTSANDAWQFKTQGGGALSPIIDIPSPASVEFKVTA